MIQLKNDEKLQKLVTDIYWGLYELKKIYLQAEYFDLFVNNKLDKEQIIKKIEKCKTLKKLYTELENLHSELHCMIVDEHPNYIKNFEGRDYEYYTDKYHHRQFWDEIELPTFILEGWNKFSELLQCVDIDTLCEGKIDEYYSIVSYDLYPCSLDFATKEELEEFTSCIDIAPCTVLQAKKYNDTNGYIEKELYNL